MVKIYNNSCKTYILQFNSDDSKIKINPKQLVDRSLVDRSLVDTGTVYLTIYDENKKIYSDYVASDGMIIIDRDLMVLKNINDIKDNLVIDYSKETIINYTLYLMIILLIFYLLV